MNRKKGDWKRARKEKQWKEQKEKGLRSFQKTTEGGTKRGRGLGKVDHRGDKGRGSDVLWGTK